MKIISLLLFLHVFFCTGFSQVKNWRNFTDMKNVRAAAVSGGKIWAATSGGAFYFNTSDNSYVKFHKVEGLSGGPLTSAAADASGKIWLGSSTGTIDVYNPATSTFKAVLDIFNSLKQPKGVNDLVFSQGKIFAATDFGISVIDPESYVFLDTYTKFGTMSSNIRVNQVFVGDIIVAALDNAVAVQKPDAVNLSSPDSWNVYNVVYQSLSRKINSVVIWNNNIVAGTEYGVFTFNGVSFIPLLTELIGTKINFVDVIEGRLIISTAEPSRLLSYYGGQLSTLYESERVFTGIFADFSNIYLLSSDGILRMEGFGMPVTEVIKPNAPYSNLFSSMTVDSKGDFWGASATDNSGQGFYKFSSGEWYNFNTATDSSIHYNHYYIAYSHGDEVYLGSWGRGFIRVRNNKFEDFNALNTPMRGISNNPDYLVVGGIAKDSKNNLWVQNYGSVTKEYLHLLTPDSTWYNFKIPAMADQYLDQVFGLVIDLQDTKWFFCQSGVRPGLYYFNEYGTLTNTNDDRSGYISGELNDKVLSLAIDKRGDLWIGTALGVNIISNTSAALSSNPNFKPTSVFSLRQHSINAIAVDPLNRKWIGTNQGLLLVNSDGSALLASYDTRNSALLADQIRSLTVDQKTGIVYAGTDAGLTAFETAAKQPVESFTELAVYPNPLKLGKTAGNELVTIDGLIKDSEIKILSITGKVINQFPSPGGRIAYWNGKDSDGEFVSSGIYIIVASDTEGNNVMTAKVAVLKE